MKRLKYDEGHRRKHNINKDKYLPADNSDSEEWVEKEIISHEINKRYITSTPELSKSFNNKERDDWMMGVGIKTYKKEVKPKLKNTEGRLDSYNPSTSSRELNPYWRDGGSGLPQTQEEFRKSAKFIKPNYNEHSDFYKKSYSTKEYADDAEIKKRRSTSSSWDINTNKGNWKRCSESNTPKKPETSPQIKSIAPQVKPVDTESKNKTHDGRYLSDEKMNKLAAKIVKAEIMGDNKLVNELKAKMEAARLYRKEHPNSGKEMAEDNIMLTTTNSTGSSRPLTKSSHFSQGKSGKKSVTYEYGERTKYFENDDQYSLKEMFEQEKYGNNYDDEAQLAKIASKHKNPNDDLEDIFTDEISKTVDINKQNERERQRAIKEHSRVEKSLEGCEFCIDSKNMLKHLMVSCGSHVYLALPSRTSLVEGHCLITTLQHSKCVTSLDEDVWDEVMNYRRSLTHFYNSQSKDLIFFETAVQFHKHPHMVVHCVPLPRDVGDSAPIYFKKALLECETEWAMNKKIIDLKGKNIRKGVPKGLPYFWVDFGMDPGFAHIIEDQRLFPKNFAQEIVGGMLDLDHSLWKNPHKEYRDQQRKKVLEFVQAWKPYDIIKK